ncbi:LysR family transcriptional regulator, partial [Limosilactobacillus fermentum]
MNIKELRYYHDLVIQKNFSKVATHFGVAQPTITMAIQRLERELGAPL